MLNEDLQNLQNDALDNINTDKVEDKTLSEEDDPYFNCNFEGKNIVDVSVNEQDNTTFITFEDGTTQQLMGTPIDISNQEIPLSRCILCGQPSGTYPLFTKDNMKFVCHDCVQEAINTYADYGYGGFTLKEVKEVNKK